jgi:predicted DNA binding CopG/RHH family protein
MKKKTKYSKHFDGLKLKDLVQLPDDFLPSPEEFARARQTAKITIEIDEKTLEWFKQKASELKIKYQPLIRDVLKAYSERSKENS